MHHAHQRHPAIHQRRDHFQVRHLMHVNDTWLKVVEGFQYNPRIALALQLVAAGKGRVPARLVLSRARSVQDPQRVAP